MCLYIYWMNIIVLVDHIFELYIYLINIILNWWKAMRQLCFVICRYIMTLHVFRPLHHSCIPLTRIDFIYNRSYLTDVAYSIYYFYYCFCLIIVLWCLSNNVLCSSCRDVSITLVNTVLIYMTLQHNIKTWL